MVDKLNKMYCNIQYIINKGIIIPIFIMYCVSIWKVIDNMDFYIDTEIISDIQKTVSTGAGTLSTNVASINSAINGFSGWEGESKTTFISSCEALTPALNSAVTSVEAYGTLLSSIFEEAENTIKVIDGYLSMIS